jgi:hypothetical protein
MLTGIYYIYKVVERDTKRMDGMKGSEKQVEWAESIKQGWIKNINAQVEEARDRVERNSMPASWLEIMEATANESITEINNIQAAKEFIDQRNLSYADTCKRVAIKKYEALTK